LVQQLSGGAQLVNRVCLTLAFIWLGSWQGITGVGVRTRCWQYTRTMLVPWHLARAILQYPGLLLIKLPSTSKVVSTGLAAYCVLDLAGT